MSIPVDIEVALLKFIASISDAEKDLETTRTQLALMPDFEPTSFFDSVDEAQKGYLSRHDIRVFLRKWDPVILEDEINHIFKHLDRNSDGKVTREEFNYFVLPVDPVSYSLAIGRRSSSLIPYPPTMEVERALATLLVQESETHRDLESRRRALYCRPSFSVAQAFAYLDKAGFGSVRPSSVQTVLQASVTDGSLVAYDDVRLIFRRLDRDDDGSLSYLEFANAILPESAPQHERISITTGDLGTTRVSIESPSRYGTTQNISVSSPVLGATINAATSRVLGAPQHVTVSASPSRFGSTSITTGDERINIREDIFGNTHVKVDSPSRGRQTLRISSPSRYGNQTVTLTEGLNSTSISTGALGGSVNINGGATVRVGSGLLGNTVSVSSPSRLPRVLSPNYTVSAYETFNREDTLRGTGLASPTRRDTASMRLTSSIAAPVTEDVSVNVAGQTVRITSPSRYGESTSVNVTGGSSLFGNSVNVSSGGILGQTVSVQDNGILGSSVRISSPSRYATLTGASTINVDNLAGSSTIRVNNNTVTVQPMSLASRVGAILNGSSPNSTSINVNGSTFNVTSGPSSPSFFRPSGLNTTSINAAGNTVRVTTSESYLGQQTNVVVTADEEDGLPRLTAPPSGDGSPRLGQTNVSVRVD